MIAGRDFVLLSVDFDRYPSSFEHLMRRFMPHNRIIWVETIGMRRPTLSWFDVKRAASKLVRMAASRHRPSRPRLPENLTVVTPAMLPFHDVSWVRRSNEDHLVRDVLGEIERRGMHDFGMITTVPLAAGLGRRLGASFVGYYCPDDWSNWPGLLNENIQMWEQRLLEESDIVVVTSEELQRTKAAGCGTPKLLPHGVDVAHFATARREVNGPLRRLTYFGLFDARTDQALLRMIATARPDVTIEIIGPVLIDVSNLKALRNVNFTGPVSYQTLPAALRSADVLILPYRLDVLSKSINPLKIRECLATGKPVVAMALKELQYIPGLMKAETRAEFVEKCLALIDGRIVPPDMDVHRLLAESSWEARAELMSDWLEPLF